MAGLAGVAALLAHLAAHLAAINGAGQAMLANYGPPLVAGLALPALAPQQWQHVAMVVALPAVPGEGAMPGGFSPLALWGVRARQQNPQHNVFGEFRSPLGFIGALIGVYGPG